MKELHKYQVLVVTDRNYGLYAAFALSILGLSTCVLEIEDKVYKEENIWPHETREDHMISLNKLNISILKPISLFYSRENGFINVTYYLKDNDIQPYDMQCDFIVFALNPHHSLLPKQKVSLDNLSFNDNSYVIGHKAMYEGKVFAAEIYTGEANLVAQHIYNKVHKTLGSIVVHSTNLM